MARQLCLKKLFGWSTLIPERTKFPVWRVPSQASAEQGVFVSGVSRQNVSGFREKDVSPMFQAANDMA